MADARETLTVVSEHDFVTSVAAAFQFVSAYHPPDFIAALTEAYRHETSAPAKEAIRQILLNSRLAARAKRPICQDTGIAGVVVRLGANARLETSRSLQSLCDEAVARAYSDETNPLRFSIVADPLFSRKNTGDNTPALVHVEHVAGDAIDVSVIAKGGGSENKSCFTVLRPRDDVADWVVEQVARMGAGWCPPGMIGVGIGGSADKAMVMAKHALLDPIDMPQLRRRGPSSPLEEFRLDLYTRINALGIGAQGLGGLTSVVDVKVKTAPCHAASLPVGIIPQCAANRHVRIRLDGTGPVFPEIPDADIWPDDVVETELSTAKQVDLDRLMREQVRAWRAGETLLLSGTLLTARDAAHARMVDMLDAGQSLPVSLENRALYYVGPVPKARGEVIGPAGPTTSRRMDPYLEPLLRQTGLLVTIGKAERGPEAIEAIRRHGAPYLVAIGGAAYLISKAIAQAQVVAFDDLGMEAIHRLVVRDMPVTVAVDATGVSIHDTGPRAFASPAPAG